MTTAPKKQACFVPSPPQVNPFARKATNVVLPSPPPLPTLVPISNTAPQLSINQPTQKANISNTASKDAVDQLVKELMTNKNTQGMGISNSNAGNGLSNKESFVRDIFKIKNPPTGLNALPSNAYTACQGPFSKNTPVVSPIVLDAKHQTFQNPLLNPNYQPAQPLIPFQSSQPSQPLAQFQPSPSQPSPFQFQNNQNTNIQPQIPFQSQINPIYYYQHNQPILLNQSQFIVDNNPPQTPMSLPDPKQSLTDFFSQLDDEMTADFQCLGSLQKGGLELLERMSEMKKAEKEYIEIEEAFLNKKILLSTAEQELEFVEKQQQKMMKEMDKFEISRGPLEYNHQLTEHLEDYQYINRQISEFMTSSSPASTKQVHPIELFRQLSSIDAQLQQCKAIVTLQLELLSTE